MNEKEINRIIKEPEFMARFTKLEEKTETHRNILFGLLIVVSGLVLLVVIPMLLS